MDKIDIFEVNELIGNKVSIALSLHSKDIIEQSEMRTRNIIDSKVGEITKKLNDEVEQVFKNMDFVNNFKKDLKNYITTSLKYSLSKDNLDFIIRSVVQDTTKNVFKDIIKDVVKNTVKELNRKLRGDYKLAKELSYSIDAEIKHVLADAPISAVSEREIKERINMSIKQTSNIFIKKMLNDKGTKQIGIEWNQKD